MNKIYKFGFPGKTVLSIMICILLAQALGAASSEQKEICGPVATGSFEWNSQNFAGFYYDLDNSVGNERLTTVLNEGKLSGDYPYGIAYETTAQEKPFSFPRWGSYSVMGFMGKKCLTGYLNSYETTSSGLFSRSKESNTFAKGELEEVLIDDDKDTSITTERPLQLKNGYQLQLKDIDGEGNKCYVELYKDNLSLSKSIILQPDIYGDDANTTLEQETYTYSIKRDSGKEKIIKVHFSGIFRGKDENIATIDTIWQSSENDTSTVLVDRKDRLTITSTKPLPLKEGYELSLKNVDLDSSKAYLELNRSDEFIDSRVISVRKGSERDGRYDYYINSKGDTSKIIEVFFKNIFQDENESFAIIDGIWQASYDDAARVILNSTEKEKISDSKPLKLGEGYEIILRSVDLSDDKAYIELHRNGELVDAAIVEPPLPAEKDESFIYSSQDGSDRAGGLEVHFKNVFRSSDLELATVDRIRQGSEGASKREVNSERHLISPRETISLQEGYLLSLRSIDITGKKAYIELIKNGEIVDFDIIRPILSKEGNEIYSYAPYEGDDRETIRLLFKSSFLGEEDNLASIERIWQSSQSQPNRVLQNSTDEVIIEGTKPMALEEGYSIILRAVDVKGDQAYIELFKDGNKVDSAVVSSRKASEADRTFTYSKDVGEVEDLLLIAVHIKNAFRGADMNLGTVDGQWQISETPILVSEGDQFDKMEVQKADSSSQSIAMANVGNQIDLQRNMDMALMGDIRLRTADEATLRYFICKVTNAEEGTETSISDASGEKKPFQGQQIAVQPQPEIGSPGNKSGEDQAAKEIVSNANKTKPLVSADGDQIIVPDAKSMINTSEWEEVPANQVIVMLKDGKGRSDADRVSSRLGGRVTGFITYLNLYQIEITGNSEAELREAIESAESDPDVELAFPNQQVHDDEAVQGQQCSPLDDPVYREGDRGKGYQLIGVQNAWDLMRVSGLQLSNVDVGVVDSGLFKGNGEFDGKVVIDATLPNSELENPLDQFGSHGTRVMNIIAADSENGGMTGIASEPLQGKLKVSMVNRNIYGNNAMGSLIALKESIKNGARIVSCSWGDSEANPGTAKAYRLYFEKMAKDHPDVLFVCSAGNDGIAANGTLRYPSGLKLPNMITVGNIMNDGSKAPKSNMESNNFEVTLAAPGEQAIKGFDNQGHILNGDGGTSMAAPQVTAAAAMIRALNPALDAESIKKILTETARSNVEIDGKKVAAPSELGGKILAIDQAVLKVINDLRSKKSPPLEALKMDGALASARVELNAVNDPVAVQDWRVTANIAGVAASGADVTIDLQGEGAVGGKKKQHLSQPGSVSWDITVKDRASVVVSRQDSGGCSRLDLASEKPSPVAKKGPLWYLDNISEEVHESDGTACIPENRVHLSGNSLDMSSSYDLQAENCAQALISGTAHSRIVWTKPPQEIAYNETANVTVTASQDDSDLKYAKSTGSGGWEMVPATNPEEVAMYIDDAPYYETTADLDYHRSCLPEETQKRGHCPEEIDLKESWNDSIRIWSGENSSRTFSFTMPIGSEIEDGEDVVFKLRFEGPGGNATLTYTYIFKGNLTDVFGEGWTDPMSHFA